MFAPRHRRCAAALGGSGLTDDGVEPESGWRVRMGAGLLAHAPMSDERRAAFDRAAQKERAQAAHDCRRSPGGVVSSWRSCPPVSGRQDAFGEFTTRSRHLYPNRHGIGLLLRVRRLQHPNVQGGCLNRRSSHTVGVVGQLQQRERMAQVLNSGTPNEDLVVLGRKRGERVS